ncbi:hypothetical protein ACW7BJ_01745 [Azospirillum argentinense]
MGYRRRNGARWPLAAPRWTITGDFMWLYVDDVAGSAPEWPLDSLWFLFGDIGLFENEMGWPLSRDPWIVEVDQQDMSNDERLDEACEWLCVNGYHYIYSTSNNYFIIERQEDAVKFKMFFG